MNRPLRLALVGLGRMGRVHLAALSGLEDLAIAAVAEPSPSSLDAAAGALEGIDVVPGVDALADRGRWIDAWLISTPTPSHLDLTRRGLETGVHVLCEKPLALDPDAGNDLGVLAKETGLVLQIGFWRRFSPPWVHARRLIREGAIGRPLLVRLSQWDADPPPAAFCDPSISGGLAVDCGVHEFDLAEWLTGLEVQRVRGYHLPLVDDGLAAVGDVDNLVATLLLDGGAAAVVDLSRNARYGDDVRTEVLGSEGAIFVDLLPTGRTRLATAAGVHVVAGSEVEDATAAGLAAQAQAFAAAVRGGGIEVPGVAASMRSVRIGRALDRSAAEGVEVAIPPTG